MTPQSTPTFASGPSAVKACPGAVAGVVGGAVSVHGGDPVSVLIPEVGVGEVCVTPSPACRLPVALWFWFTHAEKNMTCERGEKEEGDGYDGE